MKNIVTANASYTCQWLLSNVSDFTKWTQQVMDKISNRSINSAKIWLKPHQNNFFIVNFEQTSH